MGKFIIEWLEEISSGYSAVWPSAFDWGSKGREFESLYPDHFFCSLKSSPFGWTFSFYARLWLKMNALRRLSRRENTR